VQALIKGRALTAAGRWFTELMGQWPRPACFGAALVSQGPAESLAKDPGAGSCSCRHRCRTAFPGPRSPWRGAPASSSSRGWVKGPPPAGATGGWGGGRGNAGGVEDRRRTRARTRARTARPRATMADGSTTDEDKGNRREPSRGHRLLVGRPSCRFTASGEASSEVCLLGPGGRTGPKRDAASSLRPCCLQPGAARGARPSRARTSDRLPASAARLLQWLVVWIWYFAGSRAAVCCPGFPGARALLVARTFGRPGRLMPVPPPCFVCPAGDRTGGA